MKKNFGVTSKGQCMVICTGHYSVDEGLATQITLPNGKFMYTGIASVAEVMAKEKGWECKTVRYFGACDDLSINDRAHIGFPIQVDEVSVADFLEKIATEDECINCGI